MNPLISVVICAHNPRLDYFEEMLESLKTQCLDFKKWELFIIDNASDFNIEDKVNLSWHPSARVIKENKLGLTIARLRGIKESVAEMIVFVDDDNILAENYLEQALIISTQREYLGAWGGRITPRFEEPPADWTKRYWQYLAIREFDEDKWSNLPHQHETTPCGAGLCVRRCVAQSYLKAVETEPKRATLGRAGKSLASCEDIDIAFLACKTGLGTGKFTALQLTHIVPTQRLQEDYLLRLVEGIAYSSTILAALWNELPETTCFSQRLLQFYQRARMDARSRRFYDASKAGKRLAIKEVENW